MGKMPVSTSWKKRFLDYFAICLLLKKVSAQKAFSLLQLNCSGARCRYEVQELRKTQLVWWSLIKSRGERSFGLAIYYKWPLTDLWLDWLILRELKKVKLDKQQKMLLSLRSNPQTRSPYIYEWNGLCTRTDHHMLLPIVLHMVVPLYLEMW